MRGKNLSVLIESILFSMLYIVIFGEFNLAGLIVCLKITGSFAIARAIEILVCKEFDSNNSLKRHKWLKMPICFVWSGVVIYLFLNIVDFLSYGAVAVFLNQIVISTSFLTTFVYFTISYIVDVFLKIRESPFAMLDRKLGIDHSEDDFDEDDSLD